MSDFIMQDLLFWIFTAMSTDYYPRLTAVAENNRLCRDTINQQIEIALLILAPILVVFLVFINWVVILLYSKKFIPINEMIYWASLGVFFKAPSWAIGFVLLAKGAASLYFWNELIAKVYILGLTFLGYLYFGLAGLGIAFMVGYMLYLVQMYVLTKSKFEFTFSKSLIQIFIIQFSLAIGGFIVVRFISTPFNYIIGLLLIIVSSWYSIKELDRRIGLRGIFDEVKNKFIKK
jgi:O-antigen/teichoic acid export membrane protein